MKKMTKIFSHIRRKVKLNKKKDEKVFKAEKGGTTLLLDLIDCIKNVIKN